MNRRYLLIMLGGVLLIAGIGSLLDPRYKLFSLLLLAAGATCTVYGAWFAKR